MTYARATPPPMVNSTTTSGMLAWSKTTAFGATQRRQPFAEPTTPASQTLVSSPEPDPYPIKPPSSRRLLGTARLALPGMVTLFSVPTSRTERPGVATIVTFAMAPSWKGSTSMLAPVSSLTSWAAGGLAQRTSSCPLAPAMVVASRPHFLTMRRLAPCSLPLCRWL